MLCKHPIYMKAQQGIVPCGQCLPCRINKRREWTFRLCMEAITAQKKCWLTITYAPEFVPTLPDGKMTLDFKQHELFLHRLRKKYPPKTFRFFSVGEYGETYGRPHFHTCLFGIDGRTDRRDRQKIIDSWRDVSSGAPLGAIRFYPLERKNIQYTCGYTVKKMTKADDARLDGREPEAVRHSQGIGRDCIPSIAAAVQPYVDQFNDVPSSLHFDGKMWPLPRYLKEKLREALDLQEIGQETATNNYRQKMLRLRDVALEATSDKKTLYGFETSSSLDFLLSHGNTLTNGSKLDSIDLRESRFMKKGSF